MLENSNKTHVFCWTQALGKGEVRCSIHRGSTTFTGLSANLRNLRPVTSVQGNRFLGERMNGFDFYTLARFWSKVEVGRQTECWPWTGGTSEFGYGRFKIAGKLESPHRLAYEMRHGAILTNGQFHGTVVMHRCDNPRCCNPSHMTLGCQGDNARDAAEKGRLAGGGGLKKLTAADVGAIIADPRPHSVIAKQFGVSKTHVGRIKKRPQEQAA